MNIKNTLSIDKCLQSVDLIDFYITKNILKLINNKKSLEFIKKNIFLLGITNKNNKNSVMILLENSKYDIVHSLVIYNIEILGYKNIHENNLLKLLLAYSYFYEFIINYIEKSELDFILKILTDCNIQGVNFIDNLIVLINVGGDNYKEKINNDLLGKLLFIGKNIYLLDYEKKTLIITKLCKSIKNENFLLYILNFFNINNFDIYPDSNMLNCIDYLILSEFLIGLDYILDRINYIEFINIDDNLIFSFLQNSNIDIETKSKVILKILSKSNISKFKNNKNQNIFYFIIKDFGISIDVLIKFIDIINIYEQDIYGQSLFDIINKLFPKKDLKLLNSTINKNSLKLYYNEFEKINNKINLRNKLVKYDIGIFTSNIIHNMLYTIVILKSNTKYISIPYFKQSNEYKLNQEKMINMSNNEKNILSYLKLYFSNFNTWIPHLILWKNKYNYWIDPNLIIIIKEKQKSINFLYIKLSVYLLDNTNTRHSNCIIVDNINKIVERFEPYGEMIFTNSSDINIMIDTQIAKPLGYKFVFVQPYPGFQSRSDEYAKYNKTYGDPMGFCLAWSFLYIYIKLELFKFGSKINPIDYINWYIINKFEKDFDIDSNQNKTNKYILFIRYFALFLDKEKNKLLKEYKLDPGLSYQADLDIDYHNNLIKNINSDLEKICK
jgi:hypothetical protein